MLLLTSTSDKLQIVTGSAVSVDVHASWVDNAAGTITPGRQNSAITTATTTDVVPSPGASTERNLQTLAIRNKHAASSNQVTVKHTDGAVPVELYKHTLLAGETLQYIDGDGFAVIDASGQRLVGSTGSPAGVVPVGGIIMWSGTIASIDAPFALCDGTANAPGPDLRDKFIVGAKQDDAGVAKTNIAGALSQSGGATGHLHSAHANLSHAGGAVGDHTGLTHALAIANHPDLTHAALSHASQTFAHADHAVASVTHTHAAITVTPADHSVESFTGSYASGTFSVPSGTFSVPSGTGSIASHTHSVATLGLSISSQGTARTIATGSAAPGSAPSQSLTIASSTGTVASSTGTIASKTHTHAAITLTHADVGIPSSTGTHAATTLTHADHSFPSLSHQAIGTHVGTNYGVHSITQPADHGAAGTLTHSFTQPDAHTLSLHDTVSNLPSYFALAFIQRMA